MELVWCGIKLGRSSALRAKSPRLSLLPRRLPRAEEAGEEGQLVKRSKTRYLVVHEHFVSAQEEEDLFSSQVVSEQAVSISD